MSKPNPRRSNGSRRTAIRRRVLAAYDTCWICGRPVDKSLKYPDPWAPVVDEAVPVARGGSPYDFGNCRLAHAWCNRVKSDKTVEWARHEIARIESNRVAARHTVAMMPFKKPTI